MNSMQQFAYTLLEKGLVGSQGFTYRATTTDPFWNKNTLLFFE
jgi:hypothetical protein